MDLRNVSRSPFIPLPHWTIEQLDAGREAALRAFITSRGEEGTRVYEEYFKTVEPAVRSLFRETNDLLQFDSSRLSSASLVRAARWLNVPHISEDDYKTLRGPVSRRGAEEAQRVLRDRITLVLTSAWDPFRFPWLADKREPTETEREAAIRWTASFWAVEQSRTYRRKAPSKRQEAAVREMLSDAGFTRVELPHQFDIRSVDDLAMGTFAAGETLLAGLRCDVPVRLRDRRLLAIECKVSSTSVNSIKRFMHETGNKSGRWHEEFGNQALTAAVLAGVFALKNLVDVQDHFRVGVFWEHDLDPLREFVTNAR